MTANAHLFSVIPLFLLENFLHSAKFTLERSDILVAQAALGMGKTAMVSPLQQKLRVSGPVVITANRLADGAVVHRAKTGQWTDELGAAHVFWSAAEAQSALKAAQAEGLEAVGAYVAPINAGETATQPGNLREHIRVSGPTFALPSDIPERAAA